MSTLTDLMQQTWVYSLGWTLVHSLWQSALMAVTCMALLFFAKNASANFRYLTALAGLVSCLLASAATFYRYQFLSPEMLSSAKDAAPLVQAGMQDTRFDLLIFLSGHMHAIVLLWLLGFTLYSLKAVMEYRYCQHIKNTHLIETPEKWQAVFSDLCAKVGISKVVKLRVSRIVTVPCAIGYLKPVVLIPLGLLLSMNQQQIEAILLHELGHVRRNDYLLAILQAAVKNLLFFNPFLLWISHQMDKEREHACDDIAVAVSQDPLLFANTLKEFADMNTNLKPAMSIHNDKLLLKRITRLFNKPRKTTNAKNSLIAAFLVVMAGGVVSLCVNANTAEPEKTVIFTSKDLPAGEAFAMAIADINKQCGTNEKLEPFTQEVEGTRNFNIGNSQVPAKCTDAIRLVKKLYVVENISSPKDGKRVDIHMKAQPASSVMAEANKRCGTNESVAENLSSELISVNFEQIECVKILQLIKDYNP